MICEDLVKKLVRKYGDFPLYDEFHEQIKSTIADIKNIGGRARRCDNCRSIFVKLCRGCAMGTFGYRGNRWTQDGTYERVYNPKGATGFGIRTRVKLL